MTDRNQSAVAILHGNARITITLGLAIALAAAVAAPAQGQTFEVLHTFSGYGDGASPSAGLTLDRGGMFYGPTSSDSGTGGAFKLAPSGSGWILNPLHNLPPVVHKLVFGPDGNLYGTTSSGGQGSCNEGGGCGTVFKLQPGATACVYFPCRWTETVLYRFTGGSDGYAPSSEVIFDPAGNLFGVTQYGGTGTCNNLGCGVVYKLTPSGGSWTKSVIHNFASGDDGQWPLGGLIFDAAGNLYGTTELGGTADTGVLYELTPSNGGWTETILHNFQTIGGIYPAGTLLADHSGNLYGAAGGGGSVDGGTVFELGQPGNWTYVVLYNFPTFAGPNGGLVFDGSGNLYGTTYAGGAYGFGTAFKLTPSNGSWVQTDLHDFNVSDGINPNGSLIVDANGNIYGTAANGGSAFTVCDEGCGTVWEITP